MTRTWLPWMALIGLVGASLWLGLRDRPVDRDSGDAPPHSMRTPRNLDPGEGPVPPETPAPAPEAQANEPPEPSPRNAGECAWDEPPTELPRFEGEYTIGDEESTARGAGGDPAGQWTVHTTVAIIDAPVTDWMDLDRSSFSGSAWVEFREGCFRLEYASQDEMFANDGTVNRSSMEITWEGTYQVSGDVLLIEESQQEGPLAFEEARFSRRGNALTLMLMAPMPEGSATLVLEARQLH